MSDATYTDGGIDQISRLRSEIADTDTASAHFTDARLQRWLDAGLSDERLLLYLPKGHGGATGATVKVSLEDGVEPGDQRRLVLTLARTIAGEDPDTLELAPSIDHPTVADVIDWIASLGKGWAAGFRRGRDVEWANLLTPCWAENMVCTRSVGRALSVNLTLAATRAAYGSESTPAALRFYRLYDAAYTALQEMDRDGAMVSGQREADRSWSFDVKSRLDLASRNRSKGIYP